MENIIGWILTLSLTGFFGWALLQDDEGIIWKSVAAISGIAVIIFVVLNLNGITATECHDVGRRGFGTVCSYDNLPSGARVLVGFFQPFFTVGVLAIILMVAGFIGWIVSIPFRKHEHTPDLQEHTTIPSGLSNWYPPKEAYNVRPTKRVVGRQEPHFGNVVDVQVE